MRFVDGTFMVDFPDLANDTVRVGKINTRDVR